MCDDQITWMPYTDEILGLIPPVAREHTEIWRACVPLMCFDVVEHHFPDRVLRQFGLQQTRVLRSIHDRTTVVLDEAVDIQVLLRQSDVIELFSSLVTSADAPRAQPQPHELHDDDDTLTYDLFIYIIV
ncbi:unnamed protein product [Cuscuta europaea]|uniref:Aminotransferase-like plant mobile domain-containing protein n=1 Tax=Cuscuta europaea TaxID=41803 RepID=A0A9P0Z0I4_CUSEU|nr:unnamed protein product [Cuscuta europaea]